MKQSVYLKEETKKYIQEYSEKHSTTFSNALALIVEEHKSLQNRIPELESRLSEQENLVTLYTQIKDNMIKLYKTVKDNCNKL